MRKTKVICFDLFNTLVRTPQGVLSYVDIVAKYVPDRAAVYQFVKAALMTAAFTYEQMAEILVRAYGLPDSEKWPIAMTWAAENKSVEWLPGAKELLTKLKNTRRRSLLLTNCTQPALQELNQRLGLEYYFRGNIASYQVFMAKPSYLFFAEAVIRFNRGEDEFWMIGDNETDDLAVPRVMGWKTHLAKPDGSTLDELWKKLQEA